MFPSGLSGSSCRDLLLIDAEAKRVAVGASKLSSVRMTIRRAVAEGEGALEVDTPKDDWLAGTSP